MSAASHTDPSIPIWAATSTAIDASSALNETNAGNVNKLVRNSGETCPGYCVAYTGRLPYDLPWSRFHRSVSGVARANNNSSSTMTVENHPRSDHPEHIRSVAFFNRFDNNADNNSACPSLIACPPDGPVRKTTFNA